jgi:pimeloyl-ACP methyl ester carboxylesterase
MTPFTVHVADEVLADLEARIRGTRWPDQVPGIGWEQGTELDHLRETLAFWADGFDWRARERELNAFPHFHASVGEATVHFVHVRAPGGDGVPLILTHGWPSTFVELLGLVPLLTDPSAHGIDGPAFDLVVPSLPGYGFSPRPARTGVTIRYVATLWHGLMRQLGYSRYGAGGGDFGSGVATMMALQDPSRMIGLHLTNLDVDPYLGPGSAPLSDVERSFLAVRDGWDAVERGYSSIQSTRPQTVGYGLNDSPAGLAAWVLEKWRSWTDPSVHVPRDFLLTTLTIYWATQTITSSMRDYWDNRWTRAGLGPEEVVRVPTAVAGFDHQRVPEGEAPREWAQRLYDVRRWTPMPSGGHFAAVEEPQLVARDIAAFFGSLPTNPSRS